MKIKSYAKINLSLDVINRRDDGYHNLKMIMHSVDISDDIEIRINKSKKITIATNLRYLPNNKKNHAYRAAEVFFEETKIQNPGIHINIVKKIPVCAGLAGGSSDAAAVLKGLNEMFKTGLSVEKLAELGLKIGADVPYCVHGGTMLAEGVGEILTPLPPLPKAPIVLAKPNISLSTPKVFSEIHADKIKLHPDTEGMIKALRAGDLNGVCKRMYNVLEPAAQAVLNSSAVPHAVEELKEIFRNCGASGTLMSGSGPTVFGIFESEAAAKQAFSAAKKITKDAFLTTT